MAWLVGDTLAGHMLPASCSCKQIQHHTVAAPFAQTAMSGVQTLLLLTAQQVQELLSKPAIT
jgi:hypothetical protein